MVDYHMAHNCHGLSEPLSAAVRRLTLRAPLLEQLGLLHDTADIRLASFPATRTTQDLTIVQVFEGLMKYLEAFHPSHVQNFFAAIERILTISASHVYNPPSSRSRSWLNASELVAQLRRACPGASIV